MSYIRPIRPFSLLGLAVVVAMVLLAGYPVLRVIGGLFFAGGRFTIDPLREAFAIPDVGGIILNTVIVVAVSSAFALVVGTFLAWLNERTDARLGVLTDALPLIPFLLPPIAGAIGWVLLLSPRAGLLNGVLRSGLGLVGVHLAEGPLNINSWYGLIFVYTLYQVPYVFMMVSAALRGSDTSLDEQARVCGAGALRTLLTTTLPSIRPALGGAVLLMMVQGFAMFAVPIIIGTGAHITTLAVEIVRLLTFSYPARTSQAVGLSLVMLLFVGGSWLLQARILRGARYATVGGKGQQAHPVRLGGWRLPARVLMVGYGLVAVVLPTAALVIVTLSGYWSPTIAWSRLSITPFLNSVIENLPALTALVNSVEIGLVGATIGMAVSALAAWVFHHDRRLYVRVLDGGIKLPGVVSHMVVAVGFILAFAGPPFGLAGTTLILLLAYLAIYLPEGSVSADSAISQVGRELREASAVAGAREGRTFARIHLPLMAPGLVAGWAYLFARMAGDLTATALLAGPGNAVIGYLILQIFQNGTYGQLAPIAVTLTIISAVIVVAALWVSRLTGRWRRAQVTGRVANPVTDVAA